MKIEFTKAEASGNDFIILDNRGNKLVERGLNLSDFTKFSTRRKFSIGADGILVLEDSKSANFKMRIFNPDGKEVNMCGNGIRCSALYAHKEKWCPSPMKIETGAGMIGAEVEGDSVKVKMTDPHEFRLEQNIGVNKEIINVHTLDTGVPHAVHFVEGIEDYPVVDMGRSIRQHKAFYPAGTNVDFVEIKDDSTVVVRTYERGVEDETLACGTGAVASAIIAHAVKNIKQPMNVITRSKDRLKVYFRKERNSFHDVYLEGEAKIIFSGGIDYV
ncbi:MAG: diaminopimelate epimerase [Candidatus Omnitrophota bacterium]